MLGKALDSNNDIIFENKGFLQTSDGANVVQHVKTNLQAYSGEWFLDRSSGVSYFTDVLIKPVNLPLIESEIKTTIVNTFGVRTLDAFLMDFQSDIRKLVITFEATTIYGEIIGETINV